MGDDEDEVLTGTTDKLEPWTIKVFSRNTRNLVVAAARDEGITTGQWLERCIRDRLEGSAPLAQQGGRDRKPVDLAGLAEIMRASVTLAEAIELPGMKGLARDTAALVREGIREARGLPPRRAKGILAGVPLLRLEDKAGT